MELFLLKGLINMIANLKQLSKASIFVPTLTIIFFLLIFTGCASVVGYHQPAKNEQSVNKLITYTFDEFDKSGWLSTAKYLGDFEGSSGSGVTHKYRANYDSNNELEFIQLYMTLMSSSGWYFITEVLDTNGTNFEFIEIDKEALGGAVHETFAITITKNQLKEFAKSDKRLKAKGQKGSGIFTVSKHLSSAFLKSVNERG
jgi:hypothetical protein